MRLKYLKNEKPQWFKLAEGELGVSEIPGTEHNYRILQYHKTTTLKATSDEVAWCSAFVNFCMDTSGIKGTNSASARSWLKWGRPHSTPQLGAIAVFWRKSPDDWRGHVGFCVSEDEDHVLVLGGNQHNRVELKYYPKYRLLGYRWPEKFNIK